MDESSLIDDRAQLLRAAADAELSSHEAEQLAAHLASTPDDERVIQFERGLRQSIGEMASGAAPAELRSRIESLRSATPMTPSVAHACAHVATPRPDLAAPQRTRHRRLLRTVCAGGLLAAVIAGVVFIPWHASLPTGEVAVAPSHRTALVSFVNDQHAECELYAKLIAERFRIGPREDVRAELAKILDSAPDLGTLLNSPVEFLGAARCAVPGRGSSVHLVIRVPGEQSSDGVEPQELVSLFVQQDHAELNIPEGKSFSMVPTDQSASKPEHRHIQVWRNKGLVYFLVSASRQSLDAVAGVVGSLEPGGEI